MKDVSKVHPKLSVVIPMYNCEEFVPELLKMFSEQSFTEFELICVIDGATDGTEAVVKDYCKTDDRFRYVVRKNGGAGAERNTVIDMARGKYIIFSDADDEYSPEYLKKLYETAVRYDAQIVVSRFVEKNITINADIIRGFDEKKIYENIVYSHKDIDDLFRVFSARLTNKLFDLEFIRTNGLVFPDIRVSEDAYFSNATLSIAERIVVINDTLHTYRLHINQNSLSTNRFRFRRESVDSVRLLYQWLKNKSLLDYHKDDFMKWADYVLTYEGGSGATPRFISEFAHMLNAEEPWDKMTSEEILTYLREGLLAKKAVHEETELKNKVDSTIIEKDKELSFLINVYRNRIHTAELIRRVSTEYYGRNFLKPYDIPFENEKEKYDYYINKFMPSKVRLEASTICQLRCAGCGFQKGGEDDLGRGYLTIDNFKRFCEMNPFVNEIELSNWGELFLNPDLVKIMYEAKARGIKLFASNGSNFNTVSDEQMRAMVDTGFEAITLSIDGASQETYSKYRIGGDFDKVIENVRKIQRYKAKENTKLPRLKWQYILMEHNELEIGKAKKLAKELGINIEFKYNWDAEYHPINREYIMKETGLTELTRAEYVAVNGVSPYGRICRNIFFKPQINWDGRFLGCCANEYASFDVNVFEVGLEAAMKSLKYIQAKECLLSVHPDKEKYGSCICFNCNTRIQREKAGVALEL